MKFERQPSRVDSTGTDTKVTVTIILHSKELHFVLNALEFKITVQGDGHSALLVNLC